MSMQSILLDMIKAHVKTPITGAEIGVYKGETSLALLEGLPHCHLVLVDPWKEWKPTDSYYRRHNRTGRLSQSDWDDVYTEAMSRVSPYNDRITVERETSEVASRNYPVRWFDFVFIDANHTYKEVRNDIMYWLPRTNRILLGHDYGGTYPGVQQAVDEVFEGRREILLEKERLWGVVLDGVY